MPLIDFPLETLRTYKGLNPRPADFDAYWDAQRGVNALWQDRDTWCRKAILNTARMGWFSSDRTIRQYASEIWRVPA